MSESIFDGYNTFNNLLKNANKKLVKSIHNSKKLFTSFHNNILLNSNNT